MKTPWYYGWNVIAFCIVFQAISFGSVFYSFAVLAIPLTKAFTISLSQTMLATSFLQIGMGALSPLLGRALDLMPLRQLVIIGALGLCIGFIILANTSSLWILLLVYSCLLPTGLILSGSMAAQTAAARWFIRKRGLALGISAVGTSVGAFLFPPLVTALLSRYGLSTTFLAMALLSALIIIPLAWLILSRVPNTTDLESQVTTPQHPTICDKSDRNWTMVEILRQPSFWIIISGFAPICASFTSVQFNLGAYAHDHGFLSTQTASLLSTLAIAMVGGKFFFAGLSDRIDHRFLFLIMAISQGAVLISLQFSPSYTALIAILILFGFSMGGGLPLLGAMIADQFGVKAFGRLIGISTLFITASSAAGPYFTALVYDAVGSFNIAFSAIAALIIPGALAILLLKSRSPIIGSIAKSPST